MRREYDELLPIRTTFVLYSPLNSFEWASKAILALALLVLAAEKKIPSNPATSVEIHTTWSTTS
jgi:hypothetical protein